MSFQSKALHQTMHMDVYLPPNYSPSKRYPVLYMLHGYSGNQEMMLNMSINSDADQLYAQNKISPMIIVTPDYADSWGVNSVLGMFETYLMKDVIGYVDSHFSTIRDRSGRYICGVSMGGWVALYLAFTHPSTFSKVGGDSPGIFLHQADSPTVWGLIYPTPKLRKQRDPIYIAEHSSKKLQGLDVYLDCGAQDDYKFYIGTGILYHALKKARIQVQYHLNPGRHLAVYWKSHIDDYLQFYAGNQAAN